MERVPSKYKRDEVSVDEVSNKESNEHEQICYPLIDCLPVVARRRSSLRPHGLALCELHETRQKEGQKEKNPTPAAVHVSQPQSCLKLQSTAESLENRLEMELWMRRSSLMGSKRVDLNWSTSLKETDKLRGLSNHLQITNVIYCEGLDFNA
ncbi:hypothetical protein HPP92_021796 [Vanilla planifolia]|uniref:Uncharacterized protein n=1 Tax=Vanilla planifolia TaxID=51239 RepID=A0A835UFU8_VANPL|nr:hypothetical protein HPP92_021796 [Vanilla planifolia]